MVVALSFERRHLYLLLRFAVAEKIPIVSVSRNRLFFLFFSEVFVLTWQIQGTPIFV